MQVAPMLVPDSRVGRCVRIFGALVLYALALALLVTVIAVASANAAPRAMSSDECAIVADMGLVARAHSEGGIEPAKSMAIMHMIYMGEDGDAKRTTAFLTEISASAFADKRPPRVYAKDLGNHCVRNSGSIDRFLGTRL